MLSSKTKRELKIDQRQILIDSIEIGIPSPQQILNWGERTLPNGKRVGLIKNSKTVNYKRFTPFRDGLFCERIFGPVTSFVCACGKKQSHSKITFCEKCEVEYIDSRSRRYRLGYISLLSPVTHIWYLKGRPGYLSLFLGKRKKTVVALAYCNAYLISHSLSKKNISVKSDYRDRKAKIGTKGKLTKMSFGTTLSLWPFMRSTSNTNHFLQSKKISLPVSAFDFKASCTTKGKTLRSYPKKDIRNSTRPGRYSKFCFAKQLFSCSMTNPKFVSLTKFSVVPPIDSLVASAKRKASICFANKSFNLALTSLREVRRFVRGKGMTYRSTNLATRDFANKYKSTICKKSGKQSKSTICTCKGETFGNTSGEIMQNLVQRGNKTRVKLSFSSPKKTKLFLSATRESGSSLVAERNTFCVSPRKALFLSNALSTRERQKFCLKFCQKKGFIAKDSITFSKEFVLKEEQRKQKKKIKKERYSSCEVSAYSPYFYTRQQTLPFLPSLVCHFYLRDALLNFSHSVATPEDFPLMEYCDTKKWEPLRDVHRFMAHRTVEAFKDDLSYGVTRSKKAFRGPRFFEQKLDSGFDSLHTKRETKSRFFFGKASPNVSPCNKSTICTTGLDFCRSKASNFCSAKANGVSKEPVFLNPTNDTCYASFRKKGFCSAKQKNVKEALGLPAAFEVRLGKNKASRFFLDKSKKRDSMFGFVGRARKAHFETVRAYKSDSKTVRPAFFIDQLLGTQKTYAVALPPNNDQSLNIYGKNESLKQKLFFLNKSLNRVSLFKERKDFCKSNNEFFTARKTQSPFQITRSPKRSPSMKDTASRTEALTDFTNSERKILLSEDTNKSALSGLELIAIREILSYTGGGALQQLLQQFNPHELSKFLFAEAQILRVLYETKSATEKPKGDKVSFVEMESLKRQEEPITSPEESRTALLTSRKQIEDLIPPLKIEDLYEDEASTKKKTFRSSIAESNIRHRSKVSFFSAQKAKVKLLAKSYERLKQNAFFSPAKPIQNLISFEKRPRKMGLLLATKTVQRSSCLAEWVRPLQIRYLYEENKKQNAKQLIEPTPRQFLMKKSNKSSICYPPGIKSFKKRPSTLSPPWVEPRKTVYDLFCSTYGFSLKTKPFYQSSFKQIYDLLVRDFASRTNLITSRLPRYARLCITKGFPGGITYKSTICKGFPKGITYKSPICKGFAKGDAKQIEDLFEVKASPEVSPLQIEDLYAMQSKTVGRSKNYCPAKVTYKKKVYEAKQNSVKGRSILTDRLLAFKGPPDVQKKQIIRISRRIYKVARRLKIASLLTRNHRKPEWMILSHLPVLPPDLRPILQMSEKVIVASDLNIMYQRVIYRNNRHLRVRFIDFHLVTAIQRLVQDAVDRLIENGKGGTKPYYTQAGRPLKSLSDILKGKKGRFRLNLLGKRVDFSGRSVIVVSPSCKIHECGLPKEIALELYHYFLLRTLIVKRYCASIVTAKKMIKSKSSKMWEILRILMYHHPVLLNRAPTLHRLGIQAFQPKLVLGNAIALHPLVCSGFNADFDGDQMGVHLPLSFAARAESLDLLWSRNNLLSPATGQPMLVPSQDMVLGFYYMTARGFVTPNKKELYNEGITSENLKRQVFVKESLFAKDLIFGLRGQKSFQSKPPITAVRDSKNKFLNVKEIITSFETGKMKLHQPVWLYWRGKIENDEGSQKPLELRVHCFGIQNSVYEKYISRNVFTKTQAETNRVENDQNPYPHLSKRDFTGVIKELSNNFAERARANLRITDQSITLQKDSAPPFVSIYKPFKFYLKPEVCFIRTTAGRVLMNNLLKTKKDTQQF